MLKYPWLCSSQVVLLQGRSWICGKERRSRESWELTVSMLPVRPVPLVCPHADSLSPPGLPFLWPFGSSMEEVRLSVCPNWLASCFLVSKSLELWKIFPVLFKPSLRFYYSLIYSHSCRVLEISRIKMLIFNLLSLSVPAGFLKYMKVIAILIFTLDSYLNLPASFKQSFCILLLLYFVSSLWVIFFFFSSSFSKRLLVIYI